MKFFSIRTKLLLAFAVFPVIITVFNAMQTSYVINRRGEEDAFAQLSRQLRLFQQELSDLRETQVAVALDAVRDDKNLSDLAILYAQTLKFRQQPGTALERTFSLNKTTSLNRLHFILDSARLSSLAVYLDGEVSHYVTTDEVGMITRRDGQEAIIGTSHKDGENMRLVTWQTWTDTSLPVLVARHIPVVDRVTVTFEFPTTSLIVLRVIVPVQSVLRQSFLETIAEQLAIAAPDTLRPSQNGDQTPQVIGMFVFSRTLDTAWLRDFADRTGMLPAIFSPNGQPSLQLNDAGSVPSDLLAGRNNRSIQTRTITIGGTSYYQTLMRWQIGRELTLILSGALSREGTVATIEQTMTSIISATVVLFLIAGTFGYLVLTRMVAPISSLTAAVSGIGLTGAREIESVEREITLHSALGRYLDRRITPHSNDEIGALTCAFNIMAGQLHELIGNLETQVAIRTQELVDTNHQLQEEILEREQIQQALARARNELEIRVQERTADLTVSNEALRREIAERKRVEDKLRHTTEELQRVMTSISDCVWSAEVDEEGNWAYSYYSPVVEQITGRPPAFYQHNPQHWLNTIHPDDRPRLVDTFRRVLSGQSDREEEEYRIVRPDETMCWVRDCAVITRLGTRRQIYRVISDITERKQAEQERLAHLRFFECLDQVNRVIQGTNDFEQMMRDVLDATLSIFECDRAFLLYPCDPDAASWTPLMERTRPEYPGVLRLERDMPMAPDVAETLRILLNADGPVQFGLGTEHSLPTDVSECFGVKNFMAMALYPKVPSPWQFGIHQCSSPRIWTQQEERLFQEIGRRLADGLTSLLAYRELQESEAFLTNLVENIPDMMFVKDADTLQFVRVNKAGEHLLGYAREELLGKTDYDVFAKEKADFFTARDRDALSQKGLIDIPEEVISTRNHDERILHTKKIPILDEHGSPQYLLGISEDITARRQAERELQRSNDLLRAIIEAAPTAIIGLDLDGNVQAVWNPAAEKMLGWNAQEAMGRLLPSVPVESQEEFRRFREWIRSGKTLNGVDVRRQKRDGSPIDYSIYGSPLYDAEGQIIGNVAVLVDITTHKQAEEEIRRLNRELEQRVRDRTAQLETTNKELEAFAYSVSHDLRAPLRHIDGFLDLLHTSIAESLDAQSRHYMETIADAARRMGLLIDDLLAFSRMGRHELTRMSVDLNALVRDVIRDLEPETHHRNIHWQIADLPVVAGDRAMLRIVFVNLIANAVKFTRPRDRAEIEIGCQAGQDGETVVYVRDNGVGFDMQYADKLFGVFQRLHRMEDFEGTGIGLANVRRIISRHGGRAWADGAVDQGATLYVALP